MTTNNTLIMLMNYKIWADEITYNSVLELPDDELLKQRKTNFKTIIHTLNHIYVIEDIFKAHLTNNPHQYTSRNTEDVPSIKKLWLMVQSMNSWFLNFIEQSPSTYLEEIIEFQFVGGGLGKMSREEIVLHIINHATYHRGFVSDLMYQVPQKMPANDLPVFLRDSWKK
jgi:uncharacterized damage-inducible protein DinB